jgi:hypothetical protein
MQRSALLLVLLALGGCTSTLRLSLPSGVACSVIAPSGTWQLEPSSAAYQQLGRWLRENQSGWSQVYATNPNGGVFVSCGGLQLQFAGPAVITHAAKGMFSKPIKESAYAFLSVRAST